jgi:uncharacterized membrane protein
MRISPITLVFIVAAAAGLFFAGFSTHDFVEHLDRQVHSINCSFIPGLSTLDASGSSGCHVTMMSPYSSVLRSTFWGGIPIALPAMSVFAFLLFRGVDLLVNRGSDERGPRLFLVAAAALPLLTSVVMGYLSMVQLGATCKLCIGIYISSLVCFVAALLELRSARAAPGLGDDLGLGVAPVSGDNGDVRGHALSFGQGVGFVAIPALVYAIFMPDYSTFIGTCGSLVKPEDPYSVMVPLGPQGQGTPAIEVFDPLCPACKSLEGRLASSSLDQRISRKALLFPLDNTCNWMVGSALHPGACAISEAVLCAEGDADSVVAWAFENQDAIKEAAKADPAAAGKMAAEKFPKLKACIGSPGVKSKLNKSLRWAVSNQLPVLTPQLYVNGVKLCDEDTDLGMEYALTRLLDTQANGAKP